MPNQYTVRSFPEHFWSLVDKDGPIPAQCPERGPCWLWRGSLTDRGYGQINHKGKNYKAHRLAWEFTHGSSLGEMFGCHHCDNPQCVNPSHLFPGTQEENVSDRQAKGRTASGDKTISARHPELRQGENNGIAKLTDEAVREIRRLHASGVQRKVLAMQFGVKPVTISTVVSRRAWKHVT